MAGKYGGQSAWFLVDGYNRISAKLKSLSIKVASKMEPTTGLGDTWEEHTPAGRLMATVTQGDAYFDTTATTGLHAEASGGVQSSPQATTRVMCLGFGGNTIGAPFIGFEGVLTTEYDVKAEEGGLTKASVVETVSGKAEHGALVQELEEKTADWNTKTGAESLDSTTLPQRVWAISAITQANPAVITTVGNHGLTTGDKVLISGSDSSPVVDGDQAVTVISDTTFSVSVNTSAGSGGAAGSFVRSQTQNGGAGYQQVTAFSGFTGFVGKIRDSADDTTYADLVEFADVTAGPTAARVAASGQVDRYWSYDGDVTGTGSITVLSGFARAE